MDNKTVRDMMMMFLSCQRCSQLSMKPKQLKCSHTVCTRCALRNRTRNLEAGAWMLECVTCGRIDIWRDDFGELSGLTDNLLMQQMMKQTEASQGDFPSHFNEIIRNDVLSQHHGSTKYTRNIVSVVREKIEIQEAVQYAEKQMTKCQQQSRYLKSYEKKIESVKNSMVQKIQRSTELLIANVMQEKLRLLNKLKDMFQEELEPVLKAKENIQKQNDNIKMLTRCCDVATKMLQDGNSAIDMIGFKQILQKSRNNAKEFSIPSNIKRKYKTNVVLTCDEDRFETLVQNFVQLDSKLTLKQELLSTNKQEPDEGISESGPIYDTPPEEMALNKTNQDIDENEILYDEIPADYYNFETQVKIPTTDKIANDFKCSTFPQPPPRPPKSTQLNRSCPVANITAEELAAEVHNFEQRQANDSDSRIKESRRDRVDSFLSDSTIETDDQDIPEPPKLPPRSSIHIHKPFVGKSSTLGRVHTKGSTKFSQMSGKHFVQSLRLRREDTDSGISNQSSSSSDCMNEGHLLHRTVSMRSLTSLESNSPPQQRRSNKFLFSIGKLGKTGSKDSQFSTPPEIASDNQGKIWISDAGNHRIQSHEGTCGNLVSMFKTSLNGVTLKPKGLTAMKNGSKVATSCGKYVIIWDKSGQFSHKYGPQADLGKLSGLAVDSQGSLVMADVENVQIGFENSIVKITAIGRSSNGKSTWPGRITMNTLDQIITADYNEHCVKIFNADGSLAKKFGSFGTEHGQMRYPCAVAVDKYNRIYIADECNNRITMYSCDGSICHGDVLNRSDGINFPHAITVLTNGNIVVSDDSKLVKVYKGCDL